MKTKQLWIALGAIVVLAVLSFLLDWPWWVLAIIAFPVIFLLLTLAARSARARAQDRPRPSDRTTR